MVRDRDGTLVDMDTDKVTTHGIYSSHMADAGTATNRAYDVSNATVRTHAVWWLNPTTCLMRYPGRSVAVCRPAPETEARARASGRRACRSGCL